MITAVFDGSSCVTAYGLTQWDYGQRLEIKAENLEIQDGAEINFYQGSLTHNSCIVNGCTIIPDAMLQYEETIMAYVYIRSDESGETILTIQLPVQARPKPDNYVLPQQEEYKRLIPLGGDTGQVLRKASAAPCAVSWGDAADNAKIIDGALQLMSGEREIGDRIRLPGFSGSGREIELKNDGVAIVWRYTDSNEWTNLVLLDDLRGPEGATPEFEIRDGHLIAKYIE